MQPSKELFSFLDFQPSLDNGEVVSTISLEGHGNRCLSLRLESTVPILNSSENVIIGDSLAPHQHLEVL